jgi:hypothetical protein
MYAVAITSTKALIIRCSNHNEHIISCSPLYTHESLDSVCLSVCLSLSLSLSLGCDLSLLSIFTNNMEMMVINQ